MDFAVRLNSVQLGKINSALLHLQLDGFAQFSLLLPSAGKEGLFLEPSPPPTGACSVRRALRLLSGSAHLLTIIFLQPRSQKGSVLFDGLFQRVVPKTTFSSFSAELQPLAGLGVAARKVEGASLQPSLFCAWNRSRGDKET